jgi:predicted dehydrogenase/nucleoside-diphosphate-sugar epimerase
MFADTVQSVIVPGRIDCQVSGRPVIVFRTRAPAPGVYALLRERNNARGPALREDGLARRPRPAPGLHSHADRSEALSHGRPANATEFMEVGKPMRTESAITQRSTALHNGYPASGGGKGPLSVVLLGGGTMARHHATAISRLGNAARVVGVADPSPDALAAMAPLVPDAAMEQDGGRLFGKVEADVAHICTPPAHHAAAARAALEAGLHVYVEKPFALDKADAAEVLALAAQQGLQACAGHQLLYEAPSRMARELFPALGRVVHLESYFSFRPVRSGRGGQPALSAEGQLIDILPHPVYLLLSFLEEAAPGEPLDVERVRVGRGGTIHALLRRGEVTGALVVTLAGRPVESYLRVVGTNGSLHADYVRGTVQRAIGPGSSGIDKALGPYRLGRQLFGSTTVALGRRILKRQRSYPGLVEIFEVFYGAIRAGESAPMTPGSILETVAVCQRIAENLRPLEPAGPTAGSAVPSSAPRIVVTGGTGFLGREVLHQLRERGVAARSVTRRQPPAWERVPDVEHQVADLANGLSPDALEGIEAVIHCAAETSGGWDAHERNSTGATERLLVAAADAGVRHVVYISSIAVLTGPDPLTEDSPLQEGKEAGPYVWGKAQAERRARELGEELGLRVTVLRPGAIVDWRQLDPPGKLGRRIGNIFVAVGARTDTLGVVGVSDAARAAVWIALHADTAPGILNLVDPALPTKARLVKHLRQANPGLRVVWLPRALLWPVSWMAMGVQKVLRPRAPVIDVARVFARRAYDPKAALRLWEEMAAGERPEEGVSEAEPVAMSPAGTP